MKHELGDGPQDAGVERCRDLVGGSRERRERYERARLFSEEVKTWHSSKLRAAYAQPEKVRQAEERERSAEASEPS